MDDLQEKLDEFFQYEQNIGFEEKVYSDRSSLPSPQMTPDGKWVIPGTQKQFSTSQNANDALNRFSEYNKNNMASLLIYGVPYSNLMGGDTEREVPPLVQTNNGKFKFVDGKREYQSEEAAINAFTGFQKFLSKNSTEQY